MNATKVELGTRQSIAFPHIEGTALVVTRGTLWITEENDTHDIVLGPGDVWMVESHGLTIIEAQNDASFRALGRSFDRAWKAARAAQCSSSRWRMTVPASTPALPRVRDAGSDCATPANASPCCTTTGIALRRSTTNLD